MSSLSTKVGHGIAKALGIKLDYRNETDLQKEKASRGESVFTVDSADTYVEVEPTAGEWLREFTPGVRDALRYFSKLFPFTHWLHRYNVQWLIGDLVAGKELAFSPRVERIRNANSPSGRYHNWRCGCASRHGLRQTSGSSGPVWALFGLHGNSNLLALCDIEGYHHRRMSSIAGPSCSLLTVSCSLSLSCPPSRVTSSLRPESNIQIWIRTLLPLPYQSLLELLSLSLA